MRKTVQQLIERRPELRGCADAIDRMIDLAGDTFARGGTLFTCGNGGSAADADHICGELLKGFLQLRPLASDMQEAFGNRFGDEGRETAGKLQNGLRAVSLLSHPGFSSAFANDVDPDLVFAQQLWALARPGDLLLAISTGGNASNVRKALMTAAVKGVGTILLTGDRNGCCEKYADCVVAVPEKETYRIQELHLPIYHAFCMALEARFFGGGEE